MKVIISDAAVETALRAKDFLKLHELIAFARKSKPHFLHFESHKSQEAIVKTFAESVQVIYRDLLDQSVRNASMFPGTRATVKIDDVSQSDWSKNVPILTLDDALKVLNEKLAILVENSINDWNFLLGIMSQMDRELLKEYVESGWVEPLHGGGDTLGKLLDARTSKPWVSFRTFVLFDSDRLHPNEFEPDWTIERPDKRPVSCHAFEWENKTRTHMPERYWMLKRRYIESYMPKEELKQGKESKASDEAVEAFFNMSQAQRWYYNMKEGFSKDSVRDDKERARELFDSVTGEQRNSLRMGFGKTLAKHYSQSVEREFNWDSEARNEADSAIPRLMRLL